MDLVVIVVVVVVAVIATITKRWGCRHRIRAGYIGWESRRAQRCHVSSSRTRSIVENMRCLGNRLCFFFFFQSVIDPFYKSRVYIRDITSHIKRRDKVISYPLIQIEKTNYYISHFTHHLLFATCSDRYQACRGHHSPPFSACRRHLHTRRRSHTS